MALKRKLGNEEEEVVSANFRPVKQLRVSTSKFPTLQTQDIPMSDASSLPPSALSTFSDIHSSYPSFDLYPFPSYESDDIGMDIVMEASGSSSADSRTSSNASAITPSVGLLQPKSSFVHNFSNCSQIPRLRVACEMGIGGSRSLWTQCDNCGAIEMIDT